MPSPDLPPPLGATPGVDETTFAVAASHAQSVEVCLFDDESPTSPERRVALDRGPYGVWSASVPGVGPGQCYGYRVHGPWRPDEGHRHNPAKLLLDPYGRAVAGDVRWNPAIHGHVVDDTLVGDVTVRDDRDSAPYVPRSVVVDDDFDWGPHEVGIEQRRVPWSRTVLYETHVAGATRRHPGVPQALQGTYAGLAHPAFLDHVVALGVTTLELLPVHAFTHEQHLATQGRTNYWGYNTLGYFAPHRAYAADRSDPVREFKQMVAAVHSRGLEVVLDVVYNHTAEQDRSGPTLSWRGIDNRAYYRLDERGVDVDVTGCGNTLDLTHPTTLRMVLDSLRYWVSECHVDGFRFDLAVALARGGGDGGYDPHHPFLLALRTDPVLSRVKLIAEPWDVGAYGWRTGAFPPPFAEWNDRFRDTVRSYWLPDVAAGGGNGHGVRDLATRLAGSEDLFGGEGERGPIASINYVASHDGFSLADTCAYDHKHNEANGENNRDGHGDNRSWNHGVEGPTDDADVLERRHRSLRNLLATTVLSTGVPMLCAGDEFGRTQCGNNNAYCQDNETSWLDWEHQPWQRDLIATVTYLLGLRREFEVLRQRTFFSPQPRPGDGRADIRWFGRQGEPMTSAAWENPRCRILSVLLHPDSDTDTDSASLLLVFQGKPAETTVQLPALDDIGRDYELLWDSSWPTPDHGPARRVRPGETVTVGGATLQVYRAVAAGA